MRLKKIEDIQAFQKAVDECESDVWLISSDKTLQYNLKSALSQYVALGKLCTEQGVNLELWCSYKPDERHFIKLFSEHPEWR